jgi:hypothetical protein
MALVKVSEGYWINTDTIVEYADINETLCLTTTAVAERDSGGCYPYAIRLNGEEREAMLRWLAQAEQPKGGQDAIANLQLEHDVLKEHYSAALKKITALETETEARQATIDSLSAEYERVEGLCNDLGERAREAEQKLIRYC